MPSPPPSEHVWPWRHSRQQGQGHDTLGRPAACLQPSALSLRNSPESSEQDRSSLVLEGMHEAAGRLTMDLPISWTNACAALTACLMPCTMSCKIVSTHGHGAATTPERLRTVSRVAAACVCGSCLLAAEAWLPARSEGSRAHYSGGAIAA